MGSCSLASFSWLPAGPALNTNPHTDIRLGTIPQVQSRLISHSPFPIRRISANHQQIQRSYVAQPPTHPYYPHQAGHTKTAGSTSGPTSKAEGMRAVTARQQWGHQGPHARTVHSGLRPRLETQGSWALYQVISLQEHRRVGCGLGLCGLPLYVP